jgi:serine/threonine protein kinase
MIAKFTMLCMLPFKNYRAGSTCHLHLPDVACYSTRYFASFSTHRSTTFSYRALLLGQAQELCEGGALGTLITRESWGSAPAKRLYSYIDAARWSQQIARALHYLHSSHPQVLHRDLKSENLLLTKPGRAGDVHLADFGLTKLRSKPFSLFSWSLHCNVHASTANFDLVQC